MDHRLHHLRRGNHYLVRSARFANELFLYAGQLRITHFDAEIATRNHDDVGRLNNRVDVFDSLHSLDFSHNQSVSAGFPKQPANFPHIISVTNKGPGKEVQAHFGGQFDVLLVNLG